MGKRIEITWRVDDGYAGPDQPQRTRIRPENFDLEMSDDEMVEIISDAAKNDFDERVSMMIKVDDIVEVIAQVRSSLKAMKGNYALDIETHSSYIDTDRAAGITSPEFGGCDG